MSDDYLDIVFLAVGYGRRYENLLCTYAACVLETVPRSGVEMIVRNPTEFQKEHGQTLFLLERTYPKRIIVRNQSFERKVIPNSVRFYEVPQMKGTYTYIGDVDIFICDPKIVEVHKAIMEETGLPYSNKVRGSGIRLTGLHCVKTKDYYTPAFIKIQQEYLKAALPTTMDEIILFNMCKDAFGRMTPNKNRPIHGVHVSFRRRVNQIKTSSFRDFAEFVKKSEFLKTLIKVSPCTKKVLQRIGVEMEKAFESGWHASNRPMVEDHLRFFKSL